MPEGLEHAWRLPLSSFMVMICLPIWGYSILPKKELHSSLQVMSRERPTAASDLAPLAYADRGWQS